MNSETHLQERCHRLENQISALKNVSSLRKNLLGLRERQVKDLISKLKFYEILVTEERETRHSLSSRLESAESQSGQLTEKLTKNLSTIEEIKVNYENKLSTLINELQTSEQRNQQLSDQLNCAQLRISEGTKGFTMEELNRRIQEKDALIKEVQLQLKRVWERNKVLSYQMSLLNNLFNETEGVTIDFEKIKAIGDIVRESQTLADVSEDEVLSEDQGCSNERRPSVDLENLLDSMEKSENMAPADIPGEESCYKSVDTKRGPELVLSVSRTFIKLKDLIVEKKSLKKEIVTLKTLNTKLESKVDKQEHRLYRVTMELNKTWSLVSKLKQQHKRLYNSEAVLRYELQEKRALLEKLKNELSASREKWRRVRQKNSQSQIEWEKLRDEFAQRKHQSSQESGTFSEAMSVSSGENDVTLEDVEMDAQAVTSRFRSNSEQLERPTTLPLSCHTPTDMPADVTNQDDFETDGIEKEEENGACAMSPTEDETLDSEDPLEDLVSELVEDIDNEADTEEESCSRAPLENESSLSPDFEERMRRRADRLRMLEEQCLMLHQKLHASTERSEALSSKLAELHDHYGPSGSSTGTTNEEHRHDDGNAPQNREDAVAESQSHTCPTRDEASSSITSYTSSGEENNGAREEAMPDFVSNDKPENDIKYPETSASNENVLINVSEISIIAQSSSTTSDDLLNDAVQLVQGHPNSEYSCIADIPSETQDHIYSLDTASVQTTMTQIPISATSPAQAAISEGSQDSDNINPLICDITQFEPSPEAYASEAEPLEPPLSSSPPNQQEPPSSSTQEALLEQLDELLPIQETVVQHFPSTSEEEVNEFGSVQIRPEFLRILQEADEATNANSLDWMPNLLTITHNIALLRLDPESPSPGINDSSTNTRSLSESLIIEIPRQSPTPPPARVARQEDNNGSHGTNYNGDREDERSTPVRKDPSFLSRVIIQQLPKRLQLLKNENHTLLMEAAESKMRMKEMKRKLSKELEKTHQLAISLDAQIEDKNLIEFELREELEKKEKVIEELQMEIDESKQYMDELKKEKDEMDVYFKVLMDEKMDMDQCKVPPESVKTCNNCKRSFHLWTRRKYHCKICGKVFCKDCAIQREPNKRCSKRPRLCTRCHLRRQRLIALVNNPKQSTSKQN